MVLLRVVVPQMMRVERAFYECCVCGWERGCSSKSLQVAVPGGTRGSHETRPTPPNGRGTQHLTTPENGRGRQPVPRGRGQPAARYKTPKPPEALRESPPRWRTLGTRDSARRPRLPKAVPFLVPWTNIKQWDSHRPRPARASATAAARESRGRC